jgi:hypothetical protein
MGGSDFMAPEVKAAVPVPDKSDDEIQNIAERQRRRLFKGDMGRASTMLTGGSGASSAGASKAVRMLGVSGGF